MANRNIYDMDKQKVALVLSMVGAMYASGKNDDATNHPLSDRTLSTGYFNSDVRQYLR